jgi:hypothetical protein
VENQVLIIVLKQDLRPQEIIDVMKQIEGHPKVLLVKTFDSVVEDGLGVPEEKDAR